MLMVHRDVLSALHRFCKYVSDLDPDDLGRLTLGVCCVFQDIFNESHVV